MWIRDKVFNAVSCIASLLGGWQAITVLLSPLLSLASHGQPSISMRMRSLEKARAVHRMGRLRDIYEWLTTETEIRGDGSLFLNVRWKRKFKQFMDVYVLPWDENEFCRHLIRAKEG